MPFALVLKRRVAARRSRLLRSGQVFGLLAVTLPIAACSNSLDSLGSLNPMNMFSGEKYQTKVIPDTPPETLYNQGLVDLSSKDYDKATKKYSALEKQYTFSQWERKALLMETFSQYQAGNYDDAIGSAQRYIGRYAQASDLDYVYYLEAMSYYNQIPDVTRDQDRAQKASVVFQQILDKFPKSQYADDARYKLQVTRDQLAGQDMMVGRYYLQQHNYTGAINRFRDVLAKYQNTRHAEEALLRLEEAYLALGIVSEAQTAAAVLGHNFPDSPWYKDAYAKLQQGGYHPQEDTNSWISKIFHSVG
ncbi:outer membrane protein assembly factor BamD [Methylovirgula ligni]|uniref:Outer membrane protein assembly factor BamD n=1 Tax=Methylovirgula ligni TaxID=569860 RepID=A0A3D9YU90_9HYPH|nr:outer membrane protein assembly factor BamD [Methylovirgula ligni]QAY96222.1 outer membrane protein assembly factor BamD [Methylovirgula ligni]REF86075.1 Beta-barrel assembly machine subunit BamD [Methylovirgula ligni]